MMHGEKKSLRVLWAVDAFSNDRRLFKRAVAALKAWIGGRSAAIEPVFVMAPQYFPVDVYSAVAPDLSQEAKKGLVRLLEGVHLPGLLPPRVLDTDNLSLRAAVNILIEYGKRSGADIIVATTHSKTGTTRFFFGSFAESLMLQSDIPVLLINPKAKMGKTLRELLFPTDFSDESREAFSRVAKFSAERGTKLTLFHEVEFMNPYVLAACRATPAYQKQLQDNLDHRRHAMDEMAAEARALGAHVDVLFSTKGRKVSEAILSAARRGKFDAIALSSHAGAITAMVLGSNARMVLRGAECPVWVIHPSKSATVTARMREASAVPPRTAAR